VPVYDDVDPYENDFQIRKKLGCGSFSNVYECLKKGQNSDKNDRIMDIYAVKSIDTRTLTMIQIRSIRYEMNILSQLQNHENIVHLHSLYMNNKNMYLIMENLKGGELLDVICTFDTYNEMDVKLIMIQLIDVVRYMHSRNIIHRDIKPEIIMVEYVYLYIYLYTYI
jgi:serine/threonine protein kinase